ncbi:DegT/DnrJ/EryC1/StrS aminotransferase family protein [Sandaracinomonas limnophila]|uniref:GDP-perosamine synthase n=1 Tax=Sandaracinomonas limnophila TaxID=1862386 RepID=A0A437PTK8_9BACT|nr:DegT/DnrJ/EryC1/StrS aminotransferase family protein [Sandaracinomonas limnophila]RVU25605.1 DegT/DnrJ/EryC1/StrS aminotransferase family protein [Sandaracinomonas limnophila]
MNNFLYPVYRPSLNGNEKKYVNECLDSTWISSKGKFINQFETEFSKFINIDYAASVCNGTVALHLALLALDISSGDEVIVPTLTYIASVNAISYTGAKPVFVDSLKNSWQIDPEDIKNKITSKTKAIMVVHLYGHPCNMDELSKIAKEHNLFLIEDCAEAIGSKYKNRHVGTFGDISTFSFFGNKTITTGEGGMVVSNNKKLYEKVVNLKGQGLAVNREYWHDIIGYNYRMTNIQAAIGLAQLENVNDILLKKSEIANFYQESFKNTDYIFHESIGDVSNSYWMCSVLVPDRNLRDVIRLELKNLGIETRPLFYPVHTMPMYLNSKDTFPIAIDLASRGINLPSYPDLSKKDLTYIVTSLLNIKL